MLPAALQRQLVLASSSPRRAEILRMLGFEFEVVPSAVVEEDHGHPDPVEHVRRLALLKAEQVLPAAPRRLVLGADTIVVVDSDILNKPASSDEALAMLRRLRGRWHTVFTGSPCGRRRDCTVVDHESTDVRLRLGRRLPAALRRHRRMHGQGGAYAIQGLECVAGAEIRGCFITSAGLPIGCPRRAARRLPSPEV
jgi:septum formation protein